VGFHLLEQAGRRVPQEQPVSKSLVGLLIELAQVADKP
jgi:hypothetical protein